MILINHAMMGAAGQAAGGGNAPGSVMRFDGVGSRIQIGDVPILDNATAFTLSCFAAFDDVSVSRQLISKWVDGSQEFIFTYSAVSSAFLIGANENGTSGQRVIYTCPNQPVDGQENHYLVTWKGITFFNLYVNGVMQSITQQLFEGTPVFVYPGTASLDLGFDLDGTLSDCRIYNRAVSASEVAALHENRFTDSVSDGLVGWWKLNGDALDYSGNDNHGTLIGAVATGEPI